MLTIVNYKKDEYTFPALLVLGCFDAIHIGHAELLKKAKLQAKINGLDLGVMMFNGGKGGRQVYSFEERCAFLEKFNVKFVLNIDFTDEFKKTSYAEFLDTVEQYINVKGYMSGKDFRFGAGAKGKSATLKKYAEDEDNGIWYTPVKDVIFEGEKVSTTLIKECLEGGHISKANSLLGREFSVSGIVCDGNERGTTIGIPTANMQYPANKALIKQGVYGVDISFDGESYKGVANFGSRPTFGEDAPVLETYILDYNGDLYGKEITVSFINYIRGIHKFADAEALCEQIKADITHIGEPDNCEDGSEAAEPAEAEQPVVEQPVEAEQPVIEQPVETEVAAEAEAIAEEQPAEVEEVAEEPEVTAEEVVETEAATVEEINKEPETPVEEITEEPEVTAEEVVETEVAPVEEVAEEPEAPVEEVTEEPEVTTEEVVETEVTPEEETAEEPEIPVEETTEEPEVTAEEVVETEVAPVEETTEEVAEETVEEPETLVEEATEEPEVTTEEVVETEVAPVEEAAEEPETPVEEVTEEPTTEETEEATEEQTAEPEKELTPEELAELEFEREFAALLAEEEREKAEKLAAENKDDKND